jgi:hypothetical protein
MQDVIDELYKWWVWTKIYMGYAFGPQLSWDVKIVIDLLSFVMPQLRKWHWCVSGKNRPI